MIVKSIALFSAPAAFGAILFLAPVLARAQSGATNPATPPRLYRTYGKKASEVYTNIQVLKDIDCTELIPTMQYMAASLGVGCDFCHVESGSYKDDKQTKLTARKMILMTWEINKNNFHGNKVVNCAVCHRGAELPVFSTALPEEASRSAPAVTSKPPRNLPSADQILDKYLEAVGGAAAVGRISTRIEKGTFISGDTKLPLVIYTQAPDKRAVITQRADGDVIRGFNGTSGWIEITAASPPGRDFTPSETAAEKVDAHLKFAQDARKILHGVSALPPETINGEQMYVVSGTPEGLREVRLYFDEQTGLLTRVLRYIDVPLGFTPERIDYTDYRDVDGLKIPFRRTQATPSGLSIIQIDTVQQNVPIDELRFNRSPGVQGRGQ
jgi:Photosynthetic reaction centre cytochrome C subunit